MNFDCCQEKRGHRTRKSSFADSELLAVRDCGGAGFGWRAEKAWFSGKNGPKKSTTILCKSICYEKHLK
jgi:hypothetical protein